MKVTLNNPVLKNELAVKENSTNLKEEKAVLKNAASNLAKESPNEILRDIAHRVMEEGKSSAINGERKTEYVRNTYSKAVYHKHYDR